MQTGCEHATLIIIFFTWIAHSDLASFIKVSLLFKSFLTLETGVPESLCKLIFQQKLSCYESNVSLY